MNQLILYAPEAYCKLTPEAKATFGCGPGRGILADLVPDTWRMGWPLYRPLCVKPACDIHDFYYRMMPDDSKVEADAVLRNNLIRTVEWRYIEEPHPKWLLHYRLDLCETYYQAVDKWGGPAFWEGRNKPSEMCAVSLLQYRKSDGFV